MNHPVHVASILACTVCTGSPGAQYLFGLAACSLANCSPKACSELPSSPVFCSCISLLVSPLRAGLIATGLGTRTVAVNRVITRSTAGETSAATSAGLGDGEVAAPAACGAHSSARPITIVMAASRQNRIMFSSRGRRGAVISLYGSRLNELRDTARPRTAAGETAKEG